MLLPSIQALNSMKSISHTCIDTASVTNADLSQFVICAGIGSSGFSSTSVLYSLWPSLLVINGPTNYSDERNSCQPRLACELQHPGIQFNACDLSPIGTV